MLWAMRYLLSFSIVDLPPRCVSPQGCVERPTRDRWVADPLLDDLNDRQRRGAP